MKAPKGYKWESREMCELRCKRCGEIVRAECVDIHEMKHS